MPVRVVSREPQASEIAALLTTAVAAPAALVIEGEPGIGKTTLWLEAVERARTDGFHVMAARPVAAESVLAYASLADMLSDIGPDVLSELPGPQGCTRSRSASSGRRDTSGEPACSGGRISLGRDGTGGEDKSPCRSR